MSVWQSEEQRCAVVLREVFCWLGAHELARAGAACRAWRCAAAEPALWRRLLRAGPHAPHDGQRVAWRQEYVWSHAGWHLAAAYAAPDTLLHAALAPPGDTLALAAADASVAVWRRAAGVWREVGRASVRARGWSAVARVQWAGSARLLLAGPLALAADWELLVLRVEENGRCGSVASRVRCSAGAAGCWADAAGEAFLSFELRRLGAGLYCTTVWLNAATQETESEYTGVTSPLLRIYNEDGAHLTHALVAEVPLEPPHDYLSAIHPAELCAGGQVGARVLVAGAGCTLSSWRVEVPRPPALHARAGGGLAERVRRQRERRAAPEPDAPEPDEAAVRAGCTAPLHSVRLAAPLVGMALHERCACGLAGGRLLGAGVVAGGGDVRARRCGAAARRPRGVLRAAARRAARAAGAGRHRAIRVAQPRDAAVGSARRRLALRGAGMRQSARNTSRTSPSATTPQ